MITVIGIDPSVTCTGVVVVTIDAGQIKIVGAENIRPAGFRFSSLCRSIAASRFRSSAMPQVHTARESRHAGQYGGCDSWW